MVSFQCDACSDTVKKPKLDKHYMSCHSSVTCLDCSTTFAGPAQWKSHTSCISEAEKYQKGLYKGPKQQQSAVPRGNGRQNGYNNNNGGGAYQSRGPSRQEATGCNVTPLGTPLRMSPVTAVAPESPKPAQAATVKAATSEGGEKKAEGGKKDKKKDKKRKSVGGAETAEVRLARPMLVCRVC
ncbi:hypothetical protein OH76DRAFT_84579 [Lentinus brumalis]|uniref:Zinc finger C2H2 LYAR-type domain-containing protein n=1 Tax=Lentinus brumalis TaxID=2498619 RepID=A0A371CR04_9APHY|nr:hypothetical protein OH76DRAFT_84579 [Polyporus brumalis]